MILTFEDHGQDFLTWELDATGKVIECKPFQASVWCGCIVKEYNSLTPGDKVRFLTKDGDQRTMLYPVESVIPKTLNYEYIDKK